MQTFNYDDFKNEKGIVSFSEAEQIYSSLLNSSNQGNDVAWFEKFNDDRKRIGDFACYVAYIYALNAR